MSQSISVGSPDRKTSTGQAPSLLPAAWHGVSWIAGESARDALAKQRDGLNGRRLMHGDNQRIRRFLSGAHVGVRRAGVEIDRVARLQRALMLAVANVQLAFEHIEEFEAWVHVGARLVVLFKRDEL